MAAARPFPQEVDAQRLMALADACARDRDAALELETLLVELSERLQAGGLADPALLPALAQAATLATGTCLAREERFLDDEACLELVDRVGRAFSRPQDRSDTLANVALNRFRLRVGGRSDADYLELLDSALELQPPPGAPRLDLLLQTADLARVLGHWSEAEERLARAREALEVSTPNEARGEREPRSPDARPKLLLCEQIHARLELDMGRVELAWAHCERASRLASELGESSLLVQRLEELAFHAATDDFEGVVRRADTWLSSPDTPPSLRAVALYGRGLGRCLGARSRGASDELGEADLRAALSAASTSAAQRSFWSSSLADALLERGEHEEALAWVDAVEGDIPGSTLERSVHAALRARALRLGGAKREILVAERDVLIARATELLEDWDRRPLVRGGMGNLHFAASCEALGELITLELALGAGGAGEQRAFEWLVRAQARSSLARTLGAPAPTLAEARALLPEDGLLLAWLFAPHRGHLVVFDGERIEVHALEDRWTLQPAITSYAEHFARPPSELSESLRAAALEGWRADGKDLLGRVLPEPVLARALRARRLVLVGSAQLGPFPVETLPVPDGRCLGEAVAVEHWPSIPVAAALGSRERARTDARSGVLGFVAPAHDVQLGPALGLSAADLEALRVAWPGIRLATGAAATRRALLGAGTGVAAVSLFYLHGTRDPGRALWPGMALAPDRESAHDGAVWFEDLLGLDASTIVVLAACGAGRGPLRRGEDGGAHLGGLFLERGARSVVLSPWQVESRSALRLVVALGEGLGRGASLAEALRSARAAVAAEARWREPYYHQLLQLVGWSP